MDERLTTPAGTPGQQPPSVKPERGALILTLGILGLVLTCLFFLGTAAWIMGHSDLKEMKEGARDASGMALTKAGMICGIIATGIAALGLIWLLVVLMAVGTAMFGGLCGAL